MPASKALLKLQKVDYSSRRRYQPAEIYHYRLAALGRPSTAATFSYGPIAPVPHLRNANAQNCKWSKAQVMLLFKSNANVWENATYTGC